MTLNQLNEIIINLFEDKIEWLNNEYDWDDLIVFEKKEIPKAFELFKQCELRKKKNELNEYQEQARKTLTPECANMNYLTLGLASEAGEVAGKQKKLIRGDYTSEFQFEQAILPELGDCLWYISNIADRFGVSLEYIMRQNLQKLEARQLNNTIKGDGDER